MTGTHLATAPRPVPEAAPARAEVRRERRRGHGWIRSALIAAVATVGVLVALLAAAPLVGWQVVRLATGSMSPGLPTDSLLLVRHAAASEVAVGDVVTVFRGEQLPITHRVISAVPDGTQTVLELKGDANAAPDPAPYTVSDVDLLVVGVPWGGQIVTAAKSPVVLGGITVAATLLVLWAWWPRRRDAEG